jgi:hypothetical protein
MSSTTTFAQKVQDLEAAVANASSKVAITERSCVPTLMIVGLVAPLLLFLIFFFLQPSFVQRKEGSTSKRDGKKVFFWTLGLTLVLWLGMYIFSWCKGYANTAMLCAR